MGQHFKQESSVYEVAGLRVLIVREIHSAGMRKRKSRSIREEEKSRSESDEKEEGKEGEE